MAQAPADRSPVPRLQPPYLLFLFLLLRLEDLQFPLQLPISPGWGLLPLQPPCPLPLLVTLPLPVPFPLPLTALLALPQPRPATLRRGLPGWTPLLTLAGPAWRLWAPPQKQVRVEEAWPLALLQTRFEGDT